MIRKKEESSLLSETETGAKLHRLFVEAAVEVLKSFGEPNVTMQNSTDSGEFINYGEIYAAIESQENLVGWVTVSLNRDFAAKLGAQLSGMPAESFSPSDIDGIPGEILNQIFGMVRTKLWETDIRFEMALPIINPSCKEPHPFPDQKNWRRATLISGKYSIMIQDSLYSDNANTTGALSVIGNSFESR